MLLFFHKACFSSCLRCGSTVKTVVLHSDQLSQTLLNRMDKHNIAKNAHAAAFTVQRRCVLQHHALLLQTIGLYSNNVEPLLLFIAGTTASFDRAYSPIRPSSGLRDRRAHHCDMRIEPVHEPMSHHAYTLGIHLRHSATVESKVSAYERSRRDRKRCIHFPPQPRLPNPSPLLRTRFWSRLKRHLVSALPWQKASQ